jgi:hypothetical protein
MADLKSLNEGIRKGAPIEADHILRIVNALSGASENEIITKGSFESDGKFLSKGESTFEGKVIHKNDVRIDGNTVTKDITSRNITSAAVTTDLLKTKTLEIIGNPKFNLPETKEEIKNILTYNDDKTLGYVPFKIDKSYPPSDVRFKFTENSLEDENTFKGAINNISLNSTSLIIGTEIFSKVDSAPSWVRHESLLDLQNWININIMGNRFNGTTFWIKLKSEYYQHTSGKSETILTYIPS